MLRLRQQRVKVISDTTIGRNYDYNVTRKFARDNVKIAAYVTFAASHRVFVIYYERIVSP